jgi:hypothetical protein
MTTHSHILITAMLVSLWFGLAGPASAFYDPSAQRWINRDPLAERGGNNLYRFAANAPLVVHDPDGLAILPYIPNPRDPYVQCDGAGNLEIYYGAFESSPGKVCITKHENCHIEDIKERYGNDVCNGKPKGWDPVYRDSVRVPPFDDWKRRSECRAYTVERLCLLLLLDCITDPILKQQVKTQEEGASVGTARYCVGNEAVRL